MLILNCIICTELLNPSDEAHVTPCGHMFHYSCVQKWLERSKTCPQCRQKCSQSTIIRVYFNLGTLDTSRVDVNSLQADLRDAQLQNKIKEDELSKSKQEISNLKELQKKCKKTISLLEKKVEACNFTIHSYNDQLKILRDENKILEVLRRENKQHKEQIETMNSMSSILVAAIDEAEQILKHENDAKKLAAWVSTLKRELQQCKTKKENLSNQLKIVKNNLRKETENKKILEGRVEELSSTVYNMTEKIKALETNKTENQTNTNLLPENSTSPYLNVKSSSLGFIPPFSRQMGSKTSDLNNLDEEQLFNVNTSPGKFKFLTHAASLRKASSELSEKYTILKKPRLDYGNVQRFTAVERHKALLSNYEPNYNGAQISAVNANAAASENSVAKLVNIIDNTILKKSSNIVSDRLKDGRLRNIELHKNKSK